MNLTRENYRILAAKLYRSPILVDIEFNQDLILINRITNRIKKFANTGELKVKLLYNHYTVACNCFGTEYVNKAIFLLSDSATENLLITMLFSFTGNENDIQVNETKLVRFDRSKLISSVNERITRELMQ